MSEDFRMGFDAGTRSCQHMMQLRIDELQTRLAAAEALWETAVQFEGQDWADHIAQSLEAEKVGLQ